jgi:hypothetical protein
MCAHVGANGRMCAQMDAKLQKQEFSIKLMILSTFQVAIEFVTYWDDGVTTFMVIKNIIVCVFGVLALIFGSKNAILEIMELYM